MPSLVVRDVVSSLRSSGPSTLNWLFLVESLVVVILIVFYFFYFNRLLGFVVGWYLRRRYWKSTNSYLEIGGVSFSLLGGRINFSDVRYVSRNQSFRVVRGYIVWKYWLRNVRCEEDKLGNANLPCRFQVSLHGAELFLYNRTPHYDEILSKLGIHEPESMWSRGHERATSSDGLLGPIDPSTSSSSSLPNPEEAIKKLSAQQSSTISPSDPGSAETGAQKPATDDVGSGKGTDWRREALPVDFRCQTGSIVMGNPSTPSLLIAGFDRIDGLYSASKVRWHLILPPRDRDPDCRRTGPTQSRSDLDHYKESYRMVFVQPKIVYRMNPDYVGPLGVHGAGVLDKLKTAPSFFLGDFLKRPAHHVTLSSFRELLRKIPQLSKKARAEKEKAGQAKKNVGSDAAEDWSGLLRYQNSVDKGAAATHPALDRREYAKVTTLLTCPEMELNYYCDVPGKVPAKPRMITGLAGLESCDIGNGDLSPEWGIDVVIRGGEVTYGPWADRQRAEIQKAFLPPTFITTVPRPRLRVGQDRMPVAMNIFVEFTDGTSWQVPTREPSRDWKHDSVDSGSGLGTDATARAYGWLGIGLGPNSTLSVVIPMVATASGYDQQVEVHLDEVSISSSVNYAPFLRAQSCRIFLAMHSPLAWNDARTWEIDLSLANSEISLLRDHITLLTDVAKDWTSGPPGDYDHFIPFVYSLKFGLTDYVLRLFVNDHNIISNAVIDDDNALLFAHGPRLTGTALIPSDKYGMDCSVIPFHILFIDLALGMSLPNWNTHSAFVTPRTSTFATAPELTIDGSYRFYAGAHPDHVERLALDVACHDVIFKTLGWVVRYLFNLKDNYFGAFTHFVTPKDYGYRMQQEGAVQGDPLEQKWRPGQVDVFEVAVRLDLQRGIMLLPQSIYDCDDAIAIILPQLQVDLRNHDYYMEMAINADPCRIMNMVNSEAILATCDFASLLETPDCIHVQGLEIIADRLFGPQPRTATYICIWSINIGAVYGSIPPSLLQALSRAATTVAINFVDNDNALPPDLAIAADPDATFVTVDFRSIDLAVRGQTTAIQLDVSDGIAVKFDDLPEPPFLKHVDVDIPTIVLRALTPVFGRAAPWMEVASIDTDLSVVVGITGEDWEQKVQTQRSFIATQDEPTQRCPFIYGKNAAGVSSHIGGLFVPALDTPVRGHGPIRSRSELGLMNNRVRNSTVSSATSDRDEDDGDSDFESGTSTLDSENSLASTDDDGDSHSDEFVFGGERGGRLSTYGAVLRLCKRNPESTYLDRPTFARLPAASDETRSAPPHDLDTPATRAKSRLRTFAANGTKTPGDKTAIDLTCRQPIRVVLTPVAAQVGADVLEGIKLDTNFEHYLDDLFDGYVSSQKQAPTVRYVELEVRAHAPSIRMETIQDVLRPEAVISIRPQAANEVLRDTFQSTVLCTVELALDDVMFAYRHVEDHFGGAESVERPTKPIVVMSQFSGSATSTRLQVFHPEKTATYPNSTRKSHILPAIDQVPRLRPTALDLSFRLCSAGIDLSTDQAQVILRGGDAQLDFVDEAAELIIGTVWSWRVVHDFTGPLTERTLRRKLLSRRLVWAIAEAASTQGIASFPTFLNRATSLISGTSLRTDDGWKTLHHLRHCLRLSHDEVQRLMSTEQAWSSSQKLYDMLTALVSQWQSWRIDTGDLSQSAILAELFDAASPTLPPDARFDARQTVALSWDKLVMLEWDQGPLEARLWTGASSGNRLSMGPLSASIKSTGDDAPGRPVRLGGHVTLYGTEAKVDRDLLVLVRHIVGVRHTFERKLQAFAEQLETVRNSARESGDAASIVTQSDLLANLPSLEFDIALGMNHVSVKASADDLEAEGVLHGLSIRFLGGLITATPQGTTSETQLLDFEAALVIPGIAFDARVLNDDDVERLFSTELKQIHFNTHYWGSVSRRLMVPRGVQPLCKASFGVHLVDVKIPRDVIRSYELVEKWRVAALPEVDSLLIDLRLSLEGLPPTAYATQMMTAPVAANQTPKTSSAPSFPHILLANANVAVKIEFPRLRLEINAIPSLNIIYEAKDVAAEVNSSDVVAAAKEGVHGALVLGFRVGAQSVCFLPIHGFGKAESPLPAETVFALPVVRAEGIVDGLPCPTVRVEAEIDSVSLKLTVGVIDSILSMQQHFGHDIDELLRVLHARRGQATRVLAPDPQLATAQNEKESLRSHPSPSRSWNASITFSGVKVGLDGPQATQWVQAKLIKVEVGRAPPQTFARLHAKVEKLGLSLEQRPTQPQVLVSRTLDPHRLAFFQLDLRADYCKGFQDSYAPNTSYHLDERTPHLRLTFPRVHAVMQPAAVEALADLLDHFKLEIETRRGLRQMELQALRDRVTKTLDGFGSAAETAPKESPSSLKKDVDTPMAPSWLASCVLTLAFTSIGIAVPLASEGTAASIVESDSETRPAFLLSIASINFNAQKGSAGSANINVFMVQFVSEFDMTKQEHFEGSSHKTRNRINLPRMSSSLRAPTGKPIVVESEVSGLEVDLEPSIVAYLYALMDMYLLSHEHFSKLASQPEASPQSTAPVVEPLDPCHRSSSSPFALRIRAMFKFESGKIRLHSTKKGGAIGGGSTPIGTPRPGASRPSHTRSVRSLHDIRSPPRSLRYGTIDVTDDTPDLIELPVVSVWAETQDSSPSELTHLHVSIRIHGSSNILKPTLIPFITSVVNAMKNRSVIPMQAAVVRHAAVEVVPPTDPSVASTPSALGQFRLGVSLKIDESSLKITCNPVVPVTATLFWNSGGFLLTWTPGEKTVELAVTVDGISVDLRHDHARGLERCLNAEARGIAASVAFRPARDSLTGEDSGITSITVLVPDVSATANFRNLQVWMCFKAIWVDRMELDFGTSLPDSSPSTSSLALPTTSAPATRTSMVALLEITRFEITCDLGHSIGRVKLSADVLNGRLRWIPGDSKLVSSTVRSLRITGEGKASGSIVTDGVLFSTRLRDKASGAKERGTPDLLQIQIGIGETKAAIEFESKKMLALQSDPIAVDVIDDWSQTTTANAELSLAFHVKMGSFNVILTTSTFPTLIRVLHRIESLIAEKSAETDKSLADAGLPPRPATIRRSANIVPAVASKLALDDEAAKCSIRISNELKLELVRIRLAVFPDNFNEGQVFRVDAGGGVRANLTRSVEADQTTHRHLKLFLGGFSVRRVSHTRLTNKQVSEYDVPAWFELFRTSRPSVIFEIGLTEVLMKSTQAFGSNRLLHTFELTSGGQYDVTLNVGFIGVCLVLKLWLKRDPFPSASYLQYALLKTLGKVANLYQERMDQVMAEKEASRGPSTSPTDRPVSVKPQLADLSAASPTPELGAETTLSSRQNSDLSAGEPGPVMMKPTPLVQAATGAHGPLEFVAVANIKVQEPQFKQLGEATPPLKWIGVQRERYPAWVHTGVTSPLEEILILLSATYHNQLAKQKLDNSKRGSCSTQPTASRGASCDAT
ncbi:BQ2448_6263 [Microbotryum intermedium]|uniref:BQ2448_6263 protein n=1 Tax=Microbotryum intermedium TaxID=269621 RepID=A0A238FP97_9BASI|nr:BQ2448_6263 [Microbotryum intermedium]